MRADVFLEEAVAEPAVLGFVARSVVYILEATWLLWVFQLENVWMYFIA